MLNVPNWQGASHFRERDPCSKHITRWMLPWVNSVTYQALLLREIFIYIYILRERDRYRDREGEMDIQRERERETHTAGKGSTRKCWLALFMPGFQGGGEGGGGVCGKGHESFIALSRCCFCWIIYERGTWLFITPLICSHASSSQTTTYTRCLDKYEYVPEGTEEGKGSYITMVWPK